MLSEARMTEVATELVRVPGVVAVVLGGSRARGTAHPDSDVDLGLYYRPPLDVERLQTLADALADRDETRRGRVTAVGGWGPWVDGGGWLTIDDTPVDWLYRDLDRVERSVHRARAGEVEFHFQVGHPLGVPDVAYAAELALGIPLADPRGELARLTEQVADYPPALAATLVDQLQEADFLIGALAKPAQRGDVAYVAGTLFRVVGLCAHALHAAAGSWVTNEKGLVDSAGAVSGAPPEFARRAHQLLGHLGITPGGLQTAVDAAAALLSDVRTATASRAPVPR